MFATIILKYFRLGNNLTTVIEFIMAKKKSYRPKGPIQILAAIGLVIAILWTIKFIFQLGGAGYKEISSSNQGQVRALRFPAKFNNQELMNHSPAPALGEHKAEIINSLE